MGVCLQVVHTFKNGITGGAFEALAAGASDSLTVPAFVEGTKANLLEVWGADSVGVADFDIRSPNFHDNTRGLRWSYLPKPAAAVPQLGIKGPIVQPLRRTDTLVSEVDGTAADNVGQDYLMYMENLDGADQRLTSWAEIESKIVNMVGIEVVVTAGAAGDYGTAVKLTADDNRLIADTDYALLGATSQEVCELLAITAPETSNRRVGMPLNDDGGYGSQFFAELSKQYQLPLIPVINSNNRDNVTLETADTAGATAAHVCLLFAELAG